MKYPCLRLLIAGICAVTASGALAAESAGTSDASGERVQTLRKISVAATRGPEELTNIPNTVTVRSNEEIEHELARDIKDLIRYEPGVSVANASTRFGLAGFNIRGIDGNRIATRIDGVRMNEAFSIGSYSDARRNLIDLDTLKSVEIVRGPASALYGSDAIGGVVSFVTKDPADFLVDGKSLFIRGKADYRSDSDAWGLGSTLAAGGEQFGGLLIYRHGEASETENAGDIDAHDNSRTKPNSQDRKSDSVLGKLVWRPSDSQAVRLTVAHDRDETETDVFSSLGRGVGAFANIVTVGLGGDDTQKRTRVTLDHSMTPLMAAFDDLEWRIYTQTTDVEQRSLEERYSFSLGPVSTLFRDRTFKFEQKTHGAEALARKQFSWGATEHVLTYGVELLRTETDQLRDGRQTTQATGAVTSNISPDNFPVRDFPPTQTDQYALYIQDQIALPGARLQFVPAVRVDRYKLRARADEIFSADNPGVETVGIEETSVSPKLGAVWHMTDTFSAYASYMRGFRSPPFDDVNIGFTNLAFGYTAIANPDLKPEKSNGYEVGLRAATDDAFFSLATFYTDYDDFIESLVMIGIQNGLQVFQSQNLSEAHIYGAELRGDVRFLEGKVRVRSSVAYTRGAGRSQGQPDDEPINSVDPLKAVLGVAYQPSRLWSVELLGTAVDRRGHANQSTPQFVPPGYFILDLLAGVNLGEHAQLRFGVFNLTDKKYWEWSDVRGVAPTSLVLDRYTRPGINAGASFSLQF